ncbi:PssE/Cps14G family polysaccharide biosynthesis glycosyltransferase [Aeromonas sp. QDB66]|uniref:PssE/Cps14G family polysaccharide biosynthesis glycosyltransferase n=1 Tax=Aeromonas sp. QDB66 TaxID=2989824 RepID=UPI0022E3443B|nr:PssE/Cps14G family polysaccharide biosynthesis glycosyltransferase [Aeromonas sp. QDB66]
MKVLVTVGTTRFDEMIEALDLYFIGKSEFEVTFQISDGSYLPISGDHIVFSDSIERLYESSDVVISHAGAGSTFRLLEMGKLLILVPNVSRRDKHQLDIANYMSENNHALVINELSDVDKVMSDIHNFKPKAFVKEKFFKIYDIVDFIRNGVTS